MEQLAKKYSLILTGNIIVNSESPTDARRRGSSESAEISDGKEYEPIKIGFIFEGKYSSIQSFLGDLAKSLTLFDIEDMNFSRPQVEIADSRGRSGGSQRQTTPSDVYEFSMTVQTYALKKDELGANTTPIEE